VLTANAEYRKFTDTKGRIIEGEIVKYDTGREMVSIKCKKRGTKTVPIGIFSEEDQTYIISWNENQYFLSDRFLSVDVSRLKRKNKKRSHESDGMSRKSYDHNFIIKIKNTSTTDFDDVEIGYVIHFSQEIHINAKTEKKEKRGTLFEKETVTLPGKSEKNIKTKTVEIETYKESDYNLVWPDLSGKVNGIIIKLSMKTKSGETISKQIRYPENMKYAWTAQTKKP
jgi:hypothetical protein